MVGAVLAHMQISFASDMVVEFEADNAEDEARAKAESRALNKIFIEDNAGFREIMAGIQNMLLYRNGYLKCFWDEETDYYNQKHMGVEPDELGIVTEGELGKTKKLTSYDTETKTARVSVTETRKRLRVKAVANERFFVDPDWDEIALHGCSLCGEVHYKTRDQLSRMGVPWAKVRELKAISRGDGEEWENARRGQIRGTVDPIVMQMELCRVYEVYARYADDEDADRAYLYRCWLGDSGDFYLLDPEIAARVPYAAGSAFPIANSHEGESLAEKMGVVQDAKSELLRQWVSNVRNASWGRFAVSSGRADASDILRPKPGGIVRVRGDMIADAITPIPVIDVGPSISMLMENFNKQRTELGGAALDMIGAEAQIASETTATAHGTERVYASKEIKVSAMTRNASEMLRDLYLNGHAELRAGGGGPIPLKVSEEWVEEDPLQWRERKWCNVTVGPSFGERQQKANALAMSLGWDFQLIQGGMMGQMITLPGLYKKIVDWMGMNLIDNPESYYIDPTSQQAQQAAQGQAQQAQQQQQMQLQMAQMQMELEKYKITSKEQFDYFKTVLDAQVKMTESETGGTVDLIKSRTEAETIRRIGSTNAGSSNGSAGRGNTNGSGGKAET
jgi:hypothetical protein